MLLWSALQGVFELAAGMLAQARLGALGVLLMLAVGVGIRARRNGLAVGAAVVLVVLMTQA